LLGARAQWVGLAAVLLLLAGVLAALLSVERQALLQREYRHLEAQTRVMEENMTRQLQAVDLALRSIERDLDYFHAGHDDAESWNRHLQSLADAMPGVRTLLLLNGQGKVLASNRDEVVGQEVSYREYVQTPLARPSADVLYLSQPFRTPLGVYTLNLVRVQLNAEGRVERMMAATLEPDFFEILLSSVRYADDMWTAVVHHKGLLVVHQPRRPELVGSNLNRPGSFFNRHLESGREATVLEGRAATTAAPAIMAQRTLQPAALNMDGALVLAAARLPAEVLRGWWVMVWAALAVWTLVAMAGAAWLWVAQRHSAQMQRLREDRDALQRQTEQEIRQLAFYDPLTQLPNRRLLLDRLAQLQSASLRHRRRSALFFIDLDGFKQLNDQHGHHRGDLLLQEAARRLLGCVREEDTVARLGGDEFVLMLSELSGDVTEAMEKAEVVARKVLELMATEYDLDGLDHRCTASLGITLFGSQAEPVEEILKRADEAMYDAKAGGRNRFRFASGGG
jgi:diguanylate cyclase (GGDEF)-like protein